ncbi:MAG: hypothetical protein GEV11_09320, partial [Streptosporangiales bacterium]|nr:hypothetical protein [Streptosporangiales bacterium]
MDSAAPVSLSDLVPALRWTHPRNTAEALGDARLPENWWLSEPLARALATVGAERVSGALATLALREWEHLPLTDLVPALHVVTVDPGLPKWPAEVRDVVTGHVAGWEELLRLRPSDIADWAFGPGSDPARVIDTVFAEVIDRLPATPVRRPDAELMRAARIIADWMPDSAPEDVRSAVARLLTATADAADIAGATDPNRAPDAASPPETAWATAPSRGGPRGARETRPATDDPHPEHGDPRPAAVEAERDHPRPPHLSEPGQEGSDLPGRRPGDPATTSTESPAAATSDAPQPGTSAGAPPQAPAAAHGPPNTGGFPVQPAADAGAPGTPGAGATGAGATGAG